MPQTAREPATVDEFCELYKIDRSLLAEFTSLPEYTDDLYRASIAWGKSKVPELLHMLHEKYLASKQANDLKMYMELIKLDKNAMTSQGESDRRGILRELFDTSR